MIRWLIGIVVLVGVVALAGGGYWYWHQNTNAPSFRTAAVQRGNLQTTISATGTVEPEEVVDIGAQVAGRIESLGADPRDPNKSVDYTTPVEKDTVLVRIDDALFVADVEQAQAALDAAKATLLRSQADLDQAKAKLYGADRDWVRAQGLKKQPNSISEQEFDVFQTTYEGAKAAVAVGEASIEQARRAVNQAEATLKKAQRNLSYCTIRSPVKGVIIDRRVNVGQTVVSSLNAPSLFLIAKDLKRMQVWVSVNEADIGRIRVGQPVSFTVDAYPGETFRGEVGKIRLNATMTQNVVTYTVEVNTDNSNGRLLPYLTANLQFEVGKRDNVLLVPNAALRWWPQPTQIAPGSQGVDAKGGGKRGKADEPAKDAAEYGTVWVRDSRFVRPLRVKVGWSDGTNTEVSGEGISEGTEVVVGEARKNGGDAGNSNPFAPKMFGGGSGSRAQ